MFHLFGFGEYYPCGGCSDWLGMGKTFAEMDALAARPRQFDYQFYQILNGDTGEWHERIGNKWTVMPVEETGQAIDDFIDA